MKENNIPEFTSETFTNEVLTSDIKKKTTEDYVDDIVDAIFNNPKVYIQYPSNLIVDDKFVIYKNFSYTIQVCENQKPKLYYVNGLYYTVLKCIIDNNEKVDIKFPISITEVDPNTDIYPNELKDNLNRTILKYSTGKEKFYKKKLISVLYEYLLGIGSFKGTINLISDHRDYFYKNSDDYRVKYFLIKKVEVI